MNDADIEAVLEKACSTPGGKLKATYVLDDLNKIAGAYADEQTRPEAEAVLQSWTSGERGELRKGMAMAWLARARAAVAPAANAVAGAAKKVETKVGSIGAAAGEKLARSPLNAKRMAAARQVGGDEARGRMAERLQPGVTGMKGRVEAGAPAARMEPTASAAAHTQVPATGARHFGTEQAAQSGHQATGLSPDARTAAVHADALASAYKAGAENAANAHAGAAAKIGRIAARNGFRAGAAIAGVGAAGAGIHAALSDKEHKQRVEAGKHSHQGHAAAHAQNERDGLNRRTTPAEDEMLLHGRGPMMGKDAPSGELEKGFVGAIAQAAPVAPHIARLTAMRAKKVK